MTATQSASFALDDVTIKLLTWKPGPVRAVAVAVVRKAIENNYAYELLWPDEVILDFVMPQDSAAIGIAWKLLIKAGIVAKTGMFRRSKTEHSKGRTIFCYQVESMALAKTFLARNGAQPVTEPQQEMFQ